MLDYSPTDKEKIINAVSDLMELPETEGWLSFLLDVQNHLIETGFFENTTQAEHFKAAKKFFTAVCEINYSISNDNG